MNKETYEALKLLYMNYLSPLPNIDYSKEWEKIGKLIDEIDENK